MYRLLYIFFLIVPFVSQLGNDYTYDCGAASVSMLVEHSTGLQVSPGDFMEQVGRDRYLTSNDLSRLMLDYGIETAWGDDVPRIVLLGGNHWVVYLGDGYYHDPLYGPMQEGWFGSGLYVSHVKNSMLFRLER